MVATVRIPECFALKRFILFIPLIKYTIIFSNQLHEDLKLLDELGAEHVLLDWYVAGDPTTISDDDSNWRSVKLLTEQAVMLSLMLLAVSKH